MSSLEGTSSVSKYPWIQISHKYLNAHYKFSVHQISYWLSLLVVELFLLGLLMDNIMLGE